MWDSVYISSKKMLPLWYYEKGTISNLVILFRRIKIKHFLKKVTFHKIEQSLKSSNPN